MDPIVTEAGRATTDGSKYWSRSKRFTPTTGGDARPRLMDGQCLQSCCSAAPALTEPATVE
ncbi:MAG TPA: hypothetical protein VFO87_09675, partial [Nitrospira sp.]|nr:hypothetical protein [Nitrospira sp.]